MTKIILAETRGIIGVYKPKGPTSRRVLNWIQRIVDEKKVGHAGTLDPLAEGVLVVGIGRDATRKLESHVKKEKEYLAEVRLGVNSSTDDEEGVKETPPSPLLESGGTVELDQIKIVIEKFIGEIEQVPPVYSAVKINGQEAYKLARKGKEVKMKSRKRIVKEIEVLGYEWPVLKLRVVTGPGVYIRSLARDIGEELGVGGYLKSLVRTRVGEFLIEDCYEVEDN